MFLEINNLKKSFGTGESRVEVLKGIQFSVEKGEICVLLGPSGSGKSTLLNIIGGIDEADSGSIVIEGEKIEDMNEKTLTRYRRKHLGYVFQMYNLIPNLTVKENMEVGAYLSNHPLDINNLLKTLGLYDHRDKLPNQLSGGQQQRVALARALAVNPRVLLLDEPLSALDAKVRVQLRDEIRRIQLEAGTTTVFVTHDQEEALTVADRIGVMNHGCIEQIADPQTLYRRPGSEYVATFIGLTNRLPGITNGEEAVVFGQRVPLLEASKRDASTVLVRPENLVITLAANDGNMVGEHGRVDMVHFLGALARVDLTVAAGVGHLPVTVQLPANELPAGLTVGSEVVVAPRPIAALAV